MELPAHSGGAVVPGSGGGDWLFHNSIDLSSLLYSLKRFPCLLMDGEEPGRDSLKCR